MIFDKYPIMVFILMIDVFKTQLIKANIWAFRSILQIITRWQHLALHNILFYDICHLSLLYWNT